MGKFILGDCMNEKNGLPSFPDNHFDLAIVDPPYGIGADSMKFANDGGTKTGAAKRTKFHVSNWDNSTPDSNYFKELFRVSKNQIIWGWNYYVPFLSSCKCYLVWNKKTNGDFADCETAWTSFNRTALVYEFVWNGMIQSDMKNKEMRIHPTQKPVKLYQRTLTDFAKEGDLIIDTHTGSGSSLIAFESMGFDYVAFEIDKNYYSAVQKRMAKGIEKVLF